jgi:heterodisulfide reductase subunit A-like polyferredoxin
LKNLNSLRERHRLDDSSDLSGQVRARFSLAVADGNAMGNATDVLVIGGGLVALAATLAARKKGFSVTVALGVAACCLEGSLGGKKSRSQRKGAP